MEPRATAATRVTRATPPTNKCCILISPNQLVEEGWKKNYPYGYGDFKIGGHNGLKLPKLVERLPNPGEDLKKFWDTTDYPESCPDQGFFYTSKR